MSEQRREPRHACNYAVRIEAPSGDLSGHLENVSEHGAMLSVAGESPDAGAQVRVAVETSAAQASVVVDARVCWASEVIPGLVGVRIEGDDEHWSALVRAAAGA